jgi:hypothetical protein
VFLQRHGIPRSQILSRTRRVLSGLNQAATNHNYFTIKGNVPIINARSALIKPPVLLKVGKATLVFFVPGNTTFPGTNSTDASMIIFTSFAVNEGFLLHTKAQTPAHTGEAILVPLKYAYPLLGMVL